MASQKRSKSDARKTKKLKKNKLSSHESSDEEMDVNEVEIDFSGFELAPEDHNGVRLLLQQLLLKNQIDITEMTNHIIDQLDVGSVIKESEIDQTPSTSGADDDDTVYGVITVVSLTPGENLKFVDQLRSMFLELSKQHATEKTKDFVHSIFNNEGNTVGLILNERYLNLPPVISEPSFTQLKSEIEAESKKNSRFRFTHYVLISKLYKIPSKKKKQRTHSDYDVVWCNAEEELFDKMADARFEYAVKGDCDSGLSGKWTEDDEEMLPFRRVLMFKSDKLASLVAELSNCA